jgi:hypothetical protein
MRSRPSIVVLVLCLFALAWPAPAVAAPPVPSGRYLLMTRGSIYGITQGGVLQLSGGRRALSSDGIPFSPVWKHHFGSYLTTSFRCGAQNATVDLFLGGPGFGAAAVDRAGRFTAVGVTDQVVATAMVQLQGRFVSRAEAVVELVAGTYQPGQGMPSCPIPRQRFHFGLRPMPPFGRCATAPGATVLSTTRSRLYKTWGVDEGGRQTYAYACLRGGRAVSLGGTTYTFDGSVGEFRLAGRYASFVYGVNNESGRSEVLGVVDLRGRGRTVRAVDPSSENADVNHFVGKPLLSAGGSSAWVAQVCPPEHDCTAAYEVWVADRAGSRRVDQGPAIVPASLALRGSLATWTNDGVRRSAPL